MPNRSINAPSRSTIGSEDDVAFWLDGNPLVDDLAHDHAVADAQQCPDAW
jgi:hypothetical protein